MKKYVGLSLFFSLFVTILIVSSVTAQRTSQPTQADLVKNCNQAQNYLSGTLRLRDLRARVDRLQAYQYINQRVDGFVRRLERHDQPQATELRLTVTKLNSLINNFKSDYEMYDTAREQLASLRDCQDQPAVFARNLQTARGRLQTVEKDIQTIEDLLNKQVVKDLRTLETKLERERLGGKDE